MKITSQAGIEHFSDADAVTVDLVTTMKDLESLGPEWSALCEQDQGASIFQTPEWLLPWWRHVGSGELHVMTLRHRKNHLVGILPLYIYTQPSNGERHLLLLGAGTSDLLDGIFAAEQATEESQITQEFDLARIAIQSLSRHSSRWDRVIFHQLRESSLLLCCARDTGWPVTRAEDCSFIKVNGWPALPTKLRLNSGRYRRRAQARGELHFDIATTAKAALARFDQLIALHSRRWLQRGEQGVLSSVAVQKHHQETIPKLLEAGRLRLFSIDLDGHVIAVLYAFLDHCGSANASLACYLIGFDPDFANLSPGTLILSFAFDQCLIEGIRRLNLLRGGEAYKQLWGAVPEATYVLSPSHAELKALAERASRHQSPR